MEYNSISNIPEQCRWNDSDYILKTRQLANDKVVVLIFPGNNEPTCFSMHPISVQLADDLWFSVGASSNLCIYIYTYTIYIYIHTYFQYVVN